MPLWEPSTFKPPLGTPINRSHPLVANGLQAFFPCNEASGLKLNDALSGLQLVGIAGTTWISGIGPALNLSNAGSGTTPGAATTAGSLPPNLQLGGTGATNVSIACGIRYVQTGSSNEPIISLCTANANTGWFEFRATTGSSNVQMRWGGGSGSNNTFTVSPTAGTDHVYSASWNGATISFYVDGVLNGSVSSTQQLPAARLRSASDRATRSMPAGKRASISTGAASGVWL